MRMNKQERRRRRRKTLRRSFARYIKRNIWENQSDTSAILHCQYRYPISISDSIIIEESAHPLHSNDYESILRAIGDDWRSIAW